MRSASLVSIALLTVVIGGGCGKSDNPKPGPFTLTAPVDATTDVALQPTLAWGASAKAATYTLWLREGDAEFEDSDRVVADAEWATSFAIASDLERGATYYWRVTAHNADSDTQCAADFSFTTIPVAPLITSGGSGWGFAGEAFAYRIPARNDPATYGVTEALPAGLSVDTATGLISGTPAETGVFEVTLSASNAGGADTAPFTLTITPPLARYISIDLDTGARIEHADVPADLLTDAKWKTTHMVFRLIAAESFQMGDQSSPPTGAMAERPVHTVNITKPFYLGVFEVTQRQWFEVKGNWPSWFTSDPASTNEKRHVEEVSWDDINDPSTGFMDVANGLLSLPSNLTFRLPTEAEWEKACRAGTSTNYSYGDAADGAYMWYAANSIVEVHFESHEVGTKLPNPWGLYDMHGNAGERVQDRYGFTSYYQYCVDNAIADDPPGPASESARGVRGGSFGSDGGACRSASRGSTGPANASPYTGFRIAVAVTAP